MYCYIKLIYCTVRNLKVNGIISGIRCLGNVVRIIYTVKAVFIAWAAAVYKLLLCAVIYKAPSNRLIR